MYRINVHQPPGRSVGAVVTAASLLAVSVALASWVVAARGLADPVQLPGWSVTFRPPRGWSEAGLQSGSASQVVRYVETHPAGPGRELTVRRRLNPGNLSAAQICLEETGVLLGIPRPARRLVLPPWMQIAPLGPLPGVRMIHPQGVYLHVGVQNRPGGAGEAYVLTLVSEHPLGPGDLTLVETIAQAVRLGGD